MANNPKTIVQSKPKEQSLNWVKIPKNDADDQEWQTFFTSLGRPQTFDDYQISPVQESFYDQNLLQIFKQAAHKAGLTSKQASILHDEMVSALKERMMFYHQNIHQEKENIIHQLKSKWGSDYDKNLHEAQKGAKYFGLSEQAIQQLESQIGSEHMLEGLKRIGGLVSEDAKLMEVYPNPSTISASEATQKRAALTRDENFLNELFDKMHPNHKAAVEELDRLNQIIAGEK